MQQALVLIKIALVLAVCAKGLPEGNDCLLKYISDLKLPQNVVCYTKVVCNMINILLLCVHYAEGKCSILTSCDVQYTACVLNRLFQYHTAHCSWSSAQAPEEC